MQQQTIQEIIKNHFRTSYLEIEKVVCLLNFVKHKKEPEKTLSACLAYRAMKPSVNRRGIIQRQYDFSSETVYRICNECDKLKL
jgi:hypothetical protein